MLDLNATLFFKGKFEIAAKETDTDLLWQLVWNIRGWMLPKWKRNNEMIPPQTGLWSEWKLGSSFSSEHEMVHFRSLYHSADAARQYWACKIIESWPSRDGCAPREWVTEVGFQQEAPCAATVSIVIYYSDRPGFVGPCEEAPAASVPKLIRMLCQDRTLECRVGGQTLTLGATHLSAGDFPEFWRTVSDEAREVPVVYISPKRISPDGEAAETLLDPQELEEILGPNALVYYADDIAFSREMTRMCPDKTLGCYSGGVRIYVAQPHFSEPGDTYRHRFIRAGVIAEEGAERIYEILRRALVQDVHFYETMFRLDDCRQMKRHAATEEKMRKYKASLEDELLENAVAREDDLRAERAGMEEERFAWESEREELTNTIQLLKEQLYRSKAREDAYRDAARVSEEREKALDAVRAIAKYPEAPQEIAAYFRSHFADRIDFTDRGLLSLNECATSPEVLWDALYQMVTTLYELYAVEECPTVDQAFNHRSTLRMARGEGSMTRKDPGLMRQYSDSYNGRPISIEAHIKTNENRENSPRFLRVYFCFDPVSRKLVVGSCGRHLDNYSTQKIK